MKNTFLWLELSPISKCTCADLRRCAGYGSVIEAVQMTSKDNFDPRTSVDGGHLHDYRIELWARDLIFREMK